MAVPRSKTSKAVTKRRRGVNMHLDTPNLVACGNCGNLVLPHHVCKKWVSTRAVRFLLQKLMAKSGD